MHVHHALSASVQKQRMRAKVMSSLQLTPAQRTEHAALWHTWHKRRAALDRRLARVLGNLSSVLPEAEDVQLGLLAASVHLPEHMHGHGSPAATAPLQPQQPKRTAWAAGDGDCPAECTCGHVQAAEQGSIDAGSLHEMYPPVESLYAQSAAPASVPLQAPAIPIAHTCLSLIHI